MPLLMGISINIDESVTVRRVKSENEFTYQNYVKIVFLGGVI